MGGADGAPSGSLKMPKMGIRMPNMGMSKKPLKPKPRRRAHVMAGKTSGSPAGLAGALFSSTQRRTLGLLFGQPERRFFANELIGLTGSGSGAVQRELQRLTDSGLVTATKVDGRKYFQANPTTPLFGELHSIVLKTTGAAEPVKAALTPLASRIQLAVIYGSVAKRQEKASSDLDLLIVSDALTLEQLYAALAPAERQLSRKVSVTLYNSDEFQNRLKTKHPFLTKVLSGEHMVLVGSTRDLAAAG
jgi:predicted nucleotidyltransferase